MQLALPRQSLAVPLATLVIGAAGGAALTAVLNDDEVVRLPAIAPNAQVQSSGDVSPSIDPKLHPNKLGARAAGVAAATQSRPFTLDRPVSPESTGQQSSSSQLRGSKASDHGTTEPSHGGNSLGARP
jgi:hypothetical protein